jgi:hypothetical protein
MTMITTTDGTEIYCKDATLVGHCTNGGAVYIRRHGTKRVVLVAAVPPIMLKSAANPEGLPMEHFDKLRNQCTRRRVAGRDGRHRRPQPQRDGTRRCGWRSRGPDRAAVLGAGEQRTGARTRSDSAAQHQTAADRGQATLPQQQSGQSHTHELNPIDADNTSMRLLPQIFARRARTHTRRLQLYRKVIRVIRCPSVLCRLIDEFEELAQ